MARTTSTALAKPWSLEGLKDKDELERFMQASRGGDASTLPVVRQLLDARDNGEPGLTVRSEPLGACTQRTLLESVYGRDLFGIEARRREARDLKRKLGWERASELEKLLIERIAICWLDVNACQTGYHVLLQRGISPEMDTLHQKRIDRAHRRYLSAIKALAQVRKLQLPTLQVNIADKQINIAAEKAPVLP